MCNYLSNKNNDHAYEVKLCCPDYLAKYVSKAVDTYVKI